MWKWLISTWQIILFIWRYIHPIYDDLMCTIREVSNCNFTNEEARKKVFQVITDRVQARGLEKIPDSVLNCAIELCYQIYAWKKTEAKYGTKYN
jgi:hypothetical protein